VVYGDGLEIRQCNIDKPLVSVIALGADESILLQAVHQCRDVVPLGSINKVFF